MIVLDFLEAARTGQLGASQRDLAVHLGCDELQGYLFAKPMSAKALGTWAQLEDGRPGGQAAFSDSLFQETRPQDHLV